MEDDFIHLLLTDAALAGLVADRINWNHQPQDIGSPAIALYVIASTPNYTFRGQSGLTSTVVQLDTRALTYPSAISVRDALKTRISGFRGTIGATCFAGIFVRQERQNSDRPGTELFHRISLDAEIWHSPA